MLDRSRRPRSFRPSRPPRPPTRSRDRWQRPLPHGRGSELLRILQRDLEVKKVLAGGRHLDAGQVEFRTRPVRGLKIEKAIGRFMRRQQLGRERSPVDFPHIQRVLVLLWIGIGLATGIFGRSVPPSVCTSSAGVASTRRPSTPVYSTSRWSSLSAWSVSFWIMTRTGRTPY